MSDRLIVQSRTWLPNVVRMELRGYLDAESYPRLEEEFQLWFDKGISSFVLQLNDLVSLSNVGVGILVALIRTCQVAGGSVTVERPSPEARKTLERTEIYPMLHVVHSTRDAIREVAAGSDLSR